MLTLYLLRHAKSSWAEPSLSDFDRPLNKRGRRDAERLGRYLRDERINPELILISSAKRTRETYDHLSEHFSSQTNTITLEKLYGASTKGITTEICAHAGPVSSVMVIAHNPGIEDLVVQLSANDPTHALDAVAIKYPSCALSKLTFDLKNWNELAPEFRQDTNRHIGKFYHA